MARSTQTIPVEVRWRGRRVIRRIHCAPKRNFDGLFVRVSGKLRRLHGGWDEPFFCNLWPARS